MYKDTVAKIFQACSMLKKEFTNEHMDGRLNSATDEAALLSELKTVLKVIAPEIPVVISPHRYWYDIMIDNIPINLKITTGGTDNVFNKNAVIYSITGYDAKFFSGSFDKFLSRLSIYEKKTQRDKTTEYHYLVFNKLTSDFLFKSIFDIHTYVSNPCNILQINWKNEFAHKDYEISDEGYLNKVISLMGTIQKSIIVDIDSKKNFAVFDCSTLFQD